MGGLNFTLVGYDAFMHITLPLNGGVSAIGDARRKIASQLHDWEVSSLRDSVELIVSELLTNAHLHTRGPIEVAVTLLKNGIRIEVSDSETDSRVHPRTASVTDANGRGLTIVNALSADWGVIYPDSGDGKTVWAEIALLESA